MSVLYDYDNADAKAIAILFFSPKTTELIRISATYTPIIYKMPS